jgi:para-aminobenzoate synthetase component 1
MKKEINWIDPIKFAKNISENPKFNQYFVFLYSGLEEYYQNSISYLSFYPKNHIISEDFLELEDKINKNDNKNDNYFGYLAYELKNNIENFKKVEKSYIDINKLYFVNFYFNIEFFHDKKKILCRFPSHLEEDFDNLLHGIKDFEITDSKIAVNNIQSNFSDQEYLYKIKDIQERIENGDIYLANLTRKFFGDISVNNEDNYFDYFIALNSYNPANYSAFIKFDDLKIISASPELFLKIDENDKITSSPIKGTVKKSDDPKIDKENLEYLKNSPKERAENLMIVDLVRNDLSKNAIINSVKLDNLFDIISLKNIYHMVSDISAIKDPKKTIIDVIKDCFPAGSMTGVPKIKMIEICDELERIERGIYSGAIGFIGNKKCNLNVVIRSLIIKGGKFEFQSGGAITHDSIAEKELEESFLKNIAIRSIFIA